MTNEAPTKDEVEKAKEQLSWVNKIDFLGDRVPPDVDSCRKLLAHIAALEHRHDDLVTRCVQAESDRDALEEQINLMSKHQAGVDEKMCELEAKNKRLVEVLRIYANPDNFFNSNGQCYEFDCVSPDVTEEPKYLGATARHILAQTGEK